MMLPTETDIDPASLDRGVVYGKFSMQDVASIVYILTTIRDVYSKGYKYTPYFSALTCLITSLTEDPLMEGDRQIIDYRTMGLLIGFFDFMVQDELKELANPECQAGGSVFVAQLAASAQALKEAETMI